MYSSDLVIIRGTPGSGKSTLARTLLDYEQVEADMYFSRSGEYKFDSSQLPQAHRWCQAHTYELLKAGKKVVVSNTFTQLWEMKPYLDIATELNKTVEVVTLTTQYDNIHNVPTASIEKMKARWEKYPGEVIK